MVSFFSTVLLSTFIVALWFAFLALKFATISVGSSFCISNVWDDGSNRLESLVSGIRITENFCCDFFMADALQFGVQTHFGLPFFRMHRLPTLHFILSHDSKFRNLRKNEHENIWNGNICTWVRRIEKNFIFVCWFVVRRSLTSTWLAILFLDVRLDHEKWGWWKRIVKAYS